MRHDDDNASETPPGAVRIWTLTKDTREATCDAQGHLLGLELVVTVSGEILRTAVASTASAGQALADEWQQMFRAKGWTA